MFRLDLWPFRELWCSFWSRIIRTVELVMRPKYPEESVGQLRFLLAWDSILEQGFQTFLHHGGNDLLVWQTIAWLSLAPWSPKEGSIFQHIYNSFLAHWLESFALEKRNMLLCLIPSVYLVYNNLQSTSILYFTLVFSILHFTLSFTPAISSRWSK